MNYYALRVDSDNNNAPEKEQERVLGVSMCYTMCADDGSSLNDSAKNETVNETKTLKSKFRSTEAFQFKNYA